MSSVQQIISQSGIAFGTSGARGLVVAFTDDLCAAFTQSFVRVMQQNFIFERVAIGIDNRPSSPQMAAACIGMLRALGINADYYGVLPTPALAYQAMLDQVPAIMVTGSHIPFDRNGLKFYRPDGEVSKADEAAILQVTEPLLSSSPQLMAVNQAGATNYCQRYLSVFPAQILSNKHIGIFEHSSSGRELYSKVFEALGAKVTCLERSDEFVPIDTEAVSDADKKKALEWAKRHRFDAIFSTDGDGDRPLIADEHGNWLRGDIVGLLCAKALGIEALAVPVSCNAAIEKSLLFSKVVLTRIGSPYVIAALDDLSAVYNSCAGFEANGGFLLGSDIKLNGSALTALPTRDALLPFLALSTLAGNQQISSLVTQLPQRYTASDRVQNVPVEWSRTLLTGGADDPLSLLQQLGVAQQSLQSVDQTDGLRLELENGDFIHLRPSGNAPELRCYTESTSEEKAVELVLSIMTGIKGLLG